MLPFWVRLILLSFAVYRVASLVSSEEGPYLSFLYKDADQKGVFEWLRQKLGAYDYVYTYDKHGNQDRKVATNLGRGISCPLCTGGYIAFAATILYFFDYIIINFFVVWLGIWGFQIFLENLTADEAIEDAIEDVADSLENNS